MRRSAVPFAWLALSLVGCIDLSTDPHEIVAIEFTALPWPSVVAGDTLRDASGAAVPLDARLFDASGAVVTGQALDFVSRDTTVTISEEHFLIAHNTATTGAARLLASGAGLQSSVRQIELVPRPDSIEKQATIDTLRVSTIDSPTQNLSGPVGARVLSLNDDGTSTPVRSWVVTFSLTFRGVTVAPGDTNTVYLVDDASRPSAVDTTDTQGVAARHVRFKSSVSFPAPAQPDSVIVTASAGYRGTALKGSPLRLVLPVKAK